MADADKHLKHQPFYCEENIWQLCQHPDYLNGHVIFIASHGDYFPMFFQQGSDSIGGPVFWDYHVVLLNHGNIYDFNTTLPFASKVYDYIEHSFIDEDQLEPDLIPLFRVLPAKEYIATFKSDRRHMKTTNGWNAPPPEWPMICEHSSNLHQFSDMTNLEFGTVITSRELLRQHSP